ncbi:hypothetical protein Nepgr_001246 [Nepenthes gracilis]|uniref:Uncharacterized protein n=1 Tax=Nepenthes gracilis TaxID=150966 RepID=A0AAD3P880_NEPGR|nr:hypothetical protein Nepgr_001246 [Nepenthes gracilis]
MKNWIIPYLRYLTDGALPEDAEEVGPHFGDIPSSEWAGENRTLLHGFKTKLEDTWGLWVDELPLVLWSYRITPKEPTCETLFNLCYGIEVVIPIKIGLLSLRVKSFDSQGNSQKIRKYLNLLEKVRDAARMRTAAYQHRITCYYNEKVKVWQFDIGDLVLRSIEATCKMVSQNKLSPNLEEPFLVFAVPWNGAYKLRN